MEQAMPQILFFAAVGVLAWYGYKSLLKTADRVNEKMKAQTTEKKTGAQGTLIKDPDTGEYHVRKD
jgi:membrane protein implicated in regulation of membrane protease activity